MLYEHAGRAVAYGVNAAAMVVLVVSGALLARGAWNLRGAPPAVGEIVVDPVLP